MKKKIVVVSLLLCLLFCITAVSVSAAGKGTGIYGPTLKLTVDEITLLEGEMKAASEKLEGADIVVIFSDDFASDAQTQLAKYGYKSSSDNVIGLVIFTESNKTEYEVATWGSMSKALSNKKLDRIADDIETSIKSRNFKVGIQQFLSSTTSAYEKAASVNPWPTVLFVGLGIGAIASIVSILIVIFSYRKKNRSPSYPLKDYARLYLSVERDQFLGSSVTKVRVVSSSSGGSGSSGGFHSSGRR